MDYQLRTTQRNIVFLQKHQSVKTKYRQNLPALDWVHGHAIFMPLRPLPASDCACIARPHSISLTILAKARMFTTTIAASLSTARVARAQNVKIQHVLKISEHNWKLSLKFSMITDPVKLHKLSICYKRKLQGNNWGYQLRTSNRNPLNTCNTVN